MKFKLILKIGLVILMLIYPACIYFGLNHFNVRWLALMILAVLTTRAIIMPSTQRRQAIVLFAIGVLVGGLTFILNDPLYLRFYPVLMSLLMLGIFSLSLAFPPTIIELFARISFKDKPMPGHVIAYTRNVTKIWCGFLGLNACIAALTIFASWEIWTLYNGLISYILMGLLFAGEFAYRHLIVKKRHADAL